MVGPRCFKKGSGNHRDCRYYHLASSQGGAAPRSTTTCWLLLRRSRVQMVHSINDAKASKGVAFHGKCPGKPHFLPLVEKMQWQDAAKRAHRCGFRSFFDTSQRLPKLFRFICQDPQAVTRTTVHRTLASFRSGCPPLSAGSRISSQHNYWEQDKGNVADPSY